MSEAVDTSAEARFSDHSHIWLQCADDADPSVGRLWCQDKVWPETPSDGEPTQYVHADLVAALETQLDAVQVALRDREKEVGRLREALVYARRFLKPIDHDTDFVDAAIATTAPEDAA